MSAEAEGAGGQEPLSKERVLRRALALADADGIEALSMRKLARELGAGAMSLYHHVRDKEALLDGIVDLVFAEIALPEAQAEWQAAVRAWAVSARAVLARHPWAIGLMESRTVSGPATLQHREAMMAVLRRAGFPIRRAIHANWLLDSYLYGFALQEASLPFAGAEDFAGMTEVVFLPQLSATEYPCLTEAATALLQEGYDPAAEFAYGLDLILDALERDRRSA